MSADKTNLDTQRQQSRRIGGFDASRTRHRLLFALGSRVRLSRRAKIASAFIIFLIGFSVRALVAVDFSPVTGTSARPSWAMSLAFHYEAFGIVKGNGVLIRDNWDPTNTSLLIHSPGYSIYLATICTLFGKEYF